MIRYARITHLGIIADGSDLRSGSLRKNLKGIDVVAIKSKVYTYLKNAIPGLTSYIREWFLEHYNADFIELLVNQPLKVYRGLLEYYNGNEDYVDLLLVFVFKPLFMFDRELVYKALDALKRGDEKLFKELLLYVTR